MNAEKKKMIVASTYGLSVKESDNEASKRTNAFYSTNTEARKMCMQDILYVLLHVQQQGEEGEEKQLESRDVC